ncbi:MAG: caspase family protein [Oscillospiraceae bacterium]|nr:caspase family protein [Oscillospiraceae bacterium]
MKKRLLSLLLAALMLLTLLPASFAEGPETAEEPELLTLVDPEEDTIELVDPATAAPETSAANDSAVTYRALLVGEVNFYWGWWYGSETANRNRTDVELMSQMLGSVYGPMGGKYSVTSKFNLSCEGMHEAINETFAGADSNDVSLVFIATHGETSVEEGEDAGALVMVDPSYSYYVEYLQLIDLANWLKAVPGKVIVILGSCGSGAAVVSNGDRAAAAQADEAFTRAAIRAFSEAEGEVRNTGEFRDSKFYVLTAAAHMESSWGTESSGDSYNYFTASIAEAAGSGFPADTDGSRIVTLDELYQYVYEEAYGPYYDGNDYYYQHAQVYPENSNYPLFNASSLPMAELTEAFNSATGVRVSWKAVSGASKYELLRKNLTTGEKEWHKVGTTTALTLIDTTAKSSNRYTYTVRPLDKNAKNGPFDAEGRTCTYIAMSSITELKATASGVSLAWSKPAGAKNFRVMRKADGAKKWTVLAVVEGTSYLDKTAKTGTKYWYTVRGVSMDNKVVINSYNDRGWSMRPLKKPVLTEAFNSATGVRVSWNAVDKAAGYRLLRKNLTIGETAWHEVGTTTECTLIDTTAKSSNRYTYTVECIDSNGRTSSPCDETGRTCTYIAMAKITELRNRSKGVSITWEKPAGAKYFRVFRKVDGESKWQVLANVQDTTYIDTTAEKGVKYWYTVRATSSDGKIYINSFNATGWSVTRS